MEYTATELLSNTALGVVQRVRTSQIAMANIVTDVIEKGGIAFLEGATGTGKSFAYTIPAILAALKKDRRIVISTAKKGLQDQLHKKDLPYLTSKVAIVPFERLKGKSNYVCKVRLQEQGYGPLVSAIREWLAKSPDGDIADFSEEVPFEKDIVIDECLSKTCALKNTCPYASLKLRAAAAKILVVNHTLLGYDLLRGAGSILGPYDVLIIDEGHQAADSIREAYTRKLNRGVFKGITKQMKAAGFDTALALVMTSTADSLFTLLDKHPETLKRLTEAEQKIANKLWSELYSLQGQTVGVHKTTEPVEFDEKTYGLTKARAMTKLLRLFEETSDTLKMHAYDEPSKNYVYYVKHDYYRGVPSVELVAEPIEVGPIIAPQLKTIRSVVVTSATIAIGTSFDFVLRQFGLKHTEVQTAKFETPFDLKGHSALYVPLHMPPYKHAERDTILQQQILEAATLIEKSEGGAFILCASRADMNAFGDYLTKHCTQPVRVQTDIGADIIWFRNGFHNVLIGMKSLSEGVDVQGLKLRLVIIPRIPFPNPSDIVLQTRKNTARAKLMEEGGDARKVDSYLFSQYDLNLAAMDLQQAAGRLIRSENDWGVIAILDGRMNQAQGYSSFLRKALPYGFTTSSKNVYSLLENLASSVRKYEQRINTTQVG